MTEYDRLTDIVPEEEYTEDLTLIRDALMKDSSDIVLPDSIKGVNLANKMSQLPPPPIVLTKAGLGRRWLEMTAYAACFALVMFGLYKMVYFTSNDMMVRQDAAAPNQAFGAVADSSAVSVQGELSVERNARAAETSKFRDDLDRNPLFVAGEFSSSIVLPKQPVASDYSAVANAFTGAQDPLLAAQESGATMQGMGSSDAFIAAQEGPQESFADRDGESFSAVRIKSQTMSPSNFENLLSDGEYLYHYRKDFEKKGAEISIVLASDLRKVAGIKLSEHTNVRMYLLNEKLTVVQGVPQNEANKMADGIVEKTSELTGAEIDEIDLSIARNNQMRHFDVQMTEVFVYDVSNKEEPKIDKHFTLDGGYLYSDLQNETLCVITVKSIDLSTRRFDNARDLFPIVSSDGKPRILSPGEIIIPPEFSPENAGYTLISVFDFKTNKVAIKAITGKANHVLRNLDSLFIVSALRQDSTDSPGYRSEIIKMRIEPGNVFFAANKKVVGMVENADSLMEYNGTLQVAATEYNQNGEPIVRIILLDELLQSVGSVNETLHGETIQSARLLGRYGYIVSENGGESVFAVDFENFQQPLMRGPLEISKLPRVLIPVDAKKVLGVSTNDREDSFGGTYQDGLKIALYDVSNPFEIKETDHVLLGNVGSRSDAVDSKQAVLFDYENQRIGIPATLFTSRGATGQEPWGGDRRLTFDGILVFTVNDESLRIECEFSNDGAGEGYYRSDIDSAVESAVFFENKLLTSSASRLAVFDMKTCSLMQELVYSKLR